MIFAAIQVSIAGLKLTSFFINRWARGAKVGSGDEDEENVGDDGASGGISIMGVLTLIAGALILAAYCEDEPDERTFNVFKAGVYLNTFLFAVALIFICGLVIAFVLDIITRRRGRSITFRMFLGGTIVLSIAAAFFGATGIMGLKYVQNECFDEVNLFFKLREQPMAYLQLEKNYAAEDLFGTDEKPTAESLYASYEDRIIGKPVIFEEKDEDLVDGSYYVVSIVHNTTTSRGDILNMKIKTAKFVDGELALSETNARCFETAKGFTEINGLLTCKIRYSHVEEEFTRYEEATQKIVGRTQCLHKEEEIECNAESDSYPLCCNQFTPDYTDGKWHDCHCINNPSDASCQFNKDKDCSYKRNTLNLDNDDQREYYCGAQTTGWCSKDSNDKFDYKDTCKNAGNDDETFDCCIGLYQSHEWYKWGEEQSLDMTPVRV
ncbi:Oidioi.mRNA.OKI2018_I69.chr1.g265.t1.cds [Oikopleura dioica]|uniref:Oidioi.mRNA.OKI2018_I69.chr1.g265.t1.cds n=1 Tax=Oikopleura dioica TaxID=34765 RepID=A0ABN7SL07_OIKDI|nr:Oidioi.mRNA.OKI2018_I69.chr1.g265.t1.cds [Oikopleura dioica]